MSPKLPHAIRAVPVVHAAAHERVHLGLDCAFEGKANANCHDRNADEDL